MSVVIVIPARFASTRYPGKPLVELRGAEGQTRSLIRRSWEAARAVKGVSRVIVATDDSRIADHAADFGAEVAMTSPDCRNGTERCAEVLAGLPKTPEMIVNLQGDAPLTPAWFVEDLIAGLRARPGAEVATPVLNCSGAMRADLLADRAAGRVGGTTAVFGTDNRALYFSKEVIPFVPHEVPLSAPSPVFHHVGVYAYRPDALTAYASWPEGRLERLEGLEQLRFLEHGRPVLCIEVQAQGREFWELNNPEDVPRIESMMRRMGMA
ncbi:3-deoxy-manno-octulosonate cytidylyltransferase [Paracoccus sp. MC1862]|uniref:3-deoxy-manno-octulosonate cytidylyltransferase n=1 Tax=Paracoccus sp. MC1862 TaxID=2760307 RepID=UPI001600E226|nr:manno-octulosonate cytidylyltransferase [Paracoccus sp. MC1862]MBB1498803.1 3-deoxy-manno-octulosonate cytidylyltransferase [Paracoccus sp. MC1862]QQO43791.1 3-deoxy-manno-octulosonate cytidylyltransferase [Paracoccus sp. MC1862]